MKYWLVKSEPNVYGWDQFEADQTTMWDGVRNYQARNYLKQMAVGDKVLFYHSHKERAVVGDAEVVKTSYPDPTAEKNSHWVAVDIKAGRAFKNKVTLKQIKNDNKLKDMLLVKQARLSVMPLKEDEYKHVCELSENM